MPLVWRPHFEKSLAPTNVKCPCVITPTSLEEGLVAVGQTSWG